jgi:molecular chaperone HtpG
VGAFEVEITEGSTHEFTSTWRDAEPPLAYTHAKVEGRQEFTQLFFIPARAPFDLWDREHRRGIKLYVHRVFIMDDAEQLLPPWLRFVRGVVDSSDLPLNVSREILQQSRDVQTIRAASVKRVLTLLEGLAGRQPESTTFWEQFAACSRRADRNRTAIASRSCWFSSTTSDVEAQTVSLAESSAG